MRAIDLDGDLALRLKQVRDEQPRPDPARVLKMRAAIFRKVQQRRILKTTGAVMIATACATAILALPMRFTSHQQSTPRHAPAMASVDLGPADPWVVASSMRSGIEGDGWIPRHSAPRS
jgi:hypothetical protein